jgi:hypothetical protein
MFYGGARCQSLKRFAEGIPSEIMDELKGLNDFLLFDNERASKKRLT